MNLRPPRYALRAWMHHYCKHIFVVVWGAFISGLAAWFYLYFDSVDARETFGIGVFIAALVSMISGIFLSVLALWGIRYPRKSETPKPAPAPSPKPPAPVVDTYADLNPMPGRDERQSYEATMARRKAAPWCRLSEPKLARVIELYLDKGGSINVLTYGHICTRGELAQLRRDLINHGLADEWKGSAVPHERGRAELLALLPRLLRE